MKIRIPGTALAAALALAIPLHAHAQVKVGVVVSATGPTALVGIPQKNTVPLLQAKASGQDIEYITLDDASNLTQTVTAFKKLISDAHVDALIGPTGSPNAMSVLQFAAESGTPMLAPVGAASVVLPMTEQKQWAFKTTQNTDIIAQALVQDMVGRGIKTVGFIGFADAYGDDWYQVFSRMAKDKGLDLTVSERYQRTDSSVTGQALKLLAARPDAILIAGTGGAAALPQATLAQQGYKGRFYQTHGAALPAFLKFAGKSAEGTILAASLIYDAGLLLRNAIPVALKSGRPGTPEFRRALRDALEQTHELVATQGVYTMTPEDHSGFDQRGRELITVKNGAWTLLK